MRCAPPHGPGAAWIWAPSGVRGLTGTPAPAGASPGPYLSISRSAEEVALMRTLKKAMDPKGILNPGKIFDDGPTLSIVV